MHANPCREPVDRDRADGGRPRIHQPYRAGRSLLGVEAPVWCYAAEIRDTVAGLLTVPQLQVERRELVQAALQATKAGKEAKAGLVDALIVQIARAEGCSRTASFDRSAARDAGMTLLA